MVAKAPVKLPRKCILQNCHGYVFGKRRYACFQKTKRIGAMRQRTFMSRIRCNSKIVSYKLQGVVVWTAYCIFSIWAVNANWNSDDRYWNVEANSVENPNRWNDGNQILSRYCFLSSAFKAEVLLIMPRFHPPIIFPMLSILAPIEIYCLVGTSFVSQRSWKKKRSESILSDTSSSMISFLLIGV